MYKNKKVAVIIPALNEEEVITDVIREIPDYVDSIMITDNGSTDNTYGIISSGMFGKNIIPCREPRRGYGWACLKGMEQLTFEDIIVFLDGDYSDYPGKMDSILEPIVRGECEVVISNRFNELCDPGALSVPQYFGNKLSVFLIKLFWGYSYKDLGPFRAITRDGLDKMNMEDKNYGWTVELQVKALEQKLRIRQVDVPYRKRAKGTSKVSRSIKGVILAGAKIIYKIFYFKLRKLFRRN